MIIRNSQASFRTDRILGRVQLASGQVLALGDSGGDIAVIAGRVWLTRSGDLDDHVLGAGEVLREGRLRRHAGRVVDRRARRR